MTDYTDALCETTQMHLNRCDPTFSSSRSGLHAYLKVGRMHGVTVSFEYRLDADRQLSKLVRDGVVHRFLIPLGADLTNLTTGLSQGGELSILIDAVLAGHLLTLTADGATGRLTDAAAIARDELLDAVASLGPVEHSDVWAAAIAAGAAARLGAFRPVRESVAIH
jgi:hypothetical protein